MSAMRLMSMRRFSRGGYRAVTAPVTLVVRDQVVGQFVPTSTSPLPSAAPDTSPSVAAESAPRGGPTAYQRYAATLKGR